MRGALSVTVARWMTFVAGVWLRAQNFRSAAAVPPNSSTQMFDGWCSCPSLLRHTVNTPSLTDWRRLIAREFRIIRIRYRILDNLKKWGQEEHLEDGHAVTCGIFVEILRWQFKRLDSSIGFCDVVPYICHYLCRSTFLNFMYRVHVSLSFQLNKNISMLWSPKWAAFGQFGGARSGLCTCFG